MSVLPSRSGLAALPGAQHITISSAPEGTRHEAAVALLGILLVALNLRAAVVCLPPIYSLVTTSFPVDSAARSLMGTLPLLCFAVFGLLARAASRRIGLERSLLLAMVMVAVGEAARAWLSDSMAAFALLSIVCFGGMGMGNVLLPPAIAHYFPTRVGTMSGVFQVLMVVSASVPSLIAIPAADALGWRTYVGLWSLLGLVAALPWLRLAQEHHAEEHPPIPLGHAAWRWPIAWAVMIVFAAGPMVMYALIAWLPQMMIDTANVTPATAGLMLAAFNAVGLAHSLLVPMVLVKLRHPYLVIAFAVLCLCSGVLGLGYAPHTPWPWIVLAGLGCMLLNIGLTLVNMRSRTQEGTTALSSFVQSGGYLLASAGPLIVGQLHAMNGSWVTACWFMAGVATVAGFAGVIAVRTVMIEDAD